MLVGLGLCAFHRLLAPWYADADGIADEAYGFALLAVLKSLARSHTKAHFSNYCSGTAHVVRKADLHLP